MDKKKAISIITKAAKLYHDNLEDQKVLFIYGIPKEINVQISNNSDCITGLSYYQTAFHRKNFLHLTGVIVNTETIKSAINFYDKCIDGRLAENDFILAPDGSTDQKLGVIETMMNIKKTATMIGDFTGRGPKLYSEKVTGNVSACMGFISDKHTKINVPNTLLASDIRDISSKPQHKIYAILSKSYTDDTYSIIEKCEPKLDLSNVESIKELITVCTKK